MVDVEEGEKVSAVLSRENDVGGLIDVGGKD